MRGAFPPPPMPVKKKKRSAPRKKAKRVAPKKKVKRSAAKKKKVTAARATKAATKAKAKLLGKVTHYYDRIGVAILELTSPIRKGDEVLFRKGETEVAQTVESLQIDHKDVSSAAKGAVIGLKVDVPVKDGSVAYRA